MSSLKVKQIKTKLKDLFEQHLNLNDIGVNDNERENKVLSRCLAAYAVYLESACTEEDAGKAVWDGSDDNGVDAVYYDATEAKVVIVQSKWINSGGGEPSSGDIALFVNGVRDIVENNSANFHPRLHTRLNDISQAIMTPGVTLEIILISTGSSTIARHGTANIDRLLADLNDPVDQDPIARNKVIGLDEVYQSLARAAGSGGISLTATILDWSYIPQPYAAYFGLIDGLQLKEWWDSHGKRLVAKNIRYALGATDINEGIRNTGRGAPEDFWYFNNGITLIADRIIRAPKSAASRTAGAFEFMGASIVNGAQTVSTLGRVDAEDSLGKLRVSIRVIILDNAPANFGAEVTRTNNLQNRVEGRDFVARDPEQTRIQQEMSIEGVEYQFLRSEDFSLSPTSCELVEVTTALTCASMDPVLAVQVKTGIGRFFNDLTKAPYKTVFNPQTSGARAFNCTLTQREIDAWIERQKSTLAKRSGYPWGVLVHGNRVLASAVFKLIGRQPTDKTIDDFRSSLSAVDVDGKCAAVYLGMVQVLEAEYPGKFLAVLFKNPTMSKDVFDKSVALAQAANNQEAPATS
ncbi:AIPR family protein [Muricoccus aerilatus]|uniref:AIPR family protein n=1 Tax=Muricoccus aerilatus TaxID=452982 RepID=UPI0009FBB436|nr:AIPR family protein [Roseomonas aerilata]